MAVVGEAEVIIRANPRHVERDLRQVEQAAAGAARRTSRTTSTLFDQTARMMTRTLDTVSTYWTRHAPQVFQSMARTAGRSFETLGSSMVRTFDRASSLVGRGFERAFQRVYQVAPGFFDAASRQISRGWDAAMDQLGRRTTGMFERTARTVRGVFDATFTGIAAGAAGLLGTAMVTGWRRLTTIQDAITAMTVQLGSETRARDFLDQILGVVSGTPFNLDQFASIGSRLASFGVPLQKIPTYLTALGEAAATRGSQSGQVVDRLALVFGQVAASNQIQLSDVWRMADAGVNALAILANEFNLSTEAMKDMISDGAVPAQRALDALAKGIIEGSDGVAGATVAFGGSMEALRASMTGAIGGFGAALARWGQRVIEPWSDTIAALFVAATEAVDRFADVAAEVSSAIAGSAVGEGLRRALEGVPEMLNDTGSAFNRLSILMGPAVGWFTALASNRLRAQLLGMLGPLAKLLGPIANLLPRINPIVGLIVGLLTVSPDLRRAVGSLIGEILSLVGVLGKALAPVMELIAFVVAPPVELAVKALSLAIRGVAWVVGLAGDALGWLVDLLIGAVQGAFDLIGRVTTPVVTAAFDALATAAGWVWDQLVRLTSGPIGWIRTGLDAIGDAAGWVVDQLRRLAGSALGWGQDRLGDVVGWIGRQFERLAGFVMPWVHRGLDLLGDGVGWVSGQFDRLAGFVMPWVHRGLGLLGDGVDWLVDRFNQLAGFVLAGVHRGLGLVGDGIGWLVDQLRRLAGAAASWGMERLRDGLGLLNTGLERLAGFVMPWVHRGFDRLAAGAGWVRDQLERLGRATLERIYRGLDRLRPVTRWVADLFDRLRDTTVDLARSGFERLRDALGWVGGLFDRFRAGPLTRVVDGLTGFAGTVTGKVVDGWATFTRGFRGEQTALQAALDELPPGLRKAVGAFGQEVPDPEAGGFLGFLRRAGQVAGDLWGWLGDLPGRIRGVASQIVEAFNQRVTQPLRTRISDVFTTAVERGANVFDRLGGLFAEGREALAEGWSGFTTGITGRGLLDWVDDLPPALRKVITATEEAEIPVNRFAELGFRAGAGLREFAQGARQLVGAFVTGDVGEGPLVEDDRPMDWTLRARERLADWATTARDTLANWAATAGPILADWATTAGSTIAEWASTAASTIAEWATTAGQTIADWAVTARESLAEFGNWLASTVGPEVIERVLTVRDQLVEGWRTVVAFLVNDARPAVQDFMAAFGQAFLDGVVVVAGWVRDHLLPALVSFGQWVWNDGIPAVVGFAETIAGWVGGALGVAAAWVVDTLVPALIGFGVWIWTEGIPAVVAFGEQIAGWVGGALGAAASWVIDTLVPALVSFGQWLWNDGIPAVVSFGETVGGWLGDAFSGVVGWVRDTLLPVLAQFWSFIADSLIPTLVDFGSRIAGFLVEAIGNDIDWVLNTFLPAIGSVASFLWNDLLPAIIEVAGYLWEKAQPSFAALGRVVTEGVLPMLQSLWQLLWEHVIPAAIELGRIFVERVVPFVMDLVAATDTHLRPVLGWLVEQISKWVLPILGFLGQAIVWLAGLFLEHLLPRLLDIVTFILGKVVPALATFVGWLIDKIPPIVDVFVTILTTAWGIISEVTERVIDSILYWWNFGFETMRTVWENVLSPVFTRIGEALNQAQNAFAVAVDAIGRIWDGLREAAAAPVRFVVDTVINHGIIDAYNWIARKVGLGEIGHFRPGWLFGSMSSGGGRFHTGAPQLGHFGFADGGVIPGYQPGVDSVLALLSRGEAIMRPEWTRAVGIHQIETMNEIARREGVEGVRRFLAAPLIGRFQLGGVVDTIGSVGRGAVSLGRGAVDLGRRAVDWGQEFIIGNLRKAAEKMVGPLLDRIPAGMFGDLLKAGAKKLADALFSFAGKEDDKAMADAGGLAGSTTGLDPEFLRRFLAYSAEVGGLRIVSGFRSRAQQAALYARYLAGKGNLAAPPGRSKHERGLAIDHAPHSTPAMRAIARKYRLHYPVRGEPWHVEPFDVGGWLQPGVTLAMNNTGQAERVLTAEQYQRLLAAAARTPAGGIGFDSPMVEGEAFGRAIVDGMTAGLRAGAGGLRQAMEATADVVTDTVKDRLEIRSPSNVFYQLGRDTVRGFINGAVAEGASLQQAMQGLFDSAVSGVNDMIGAINILRANHKTVLDLQKAEQELALVRSSRFATAEQIAEAEANLMDAQLARLSSEIRLIDTGQHIATTSTHQARQMFDSVASRVLGPEATRLFNQWFQEFHTHSLNAFRHSLTPRAGGGFITRPEITYQGERGPELVLPLTRRDRMAELLADPRAEGVRELAAAIRGGGGATVNYHFHGVEFDVALARARRDERRRLSVGSRR